MLGKALPPKKRQFDTTIHSYKHTSLITWLLCSI